MSLARPLLCAEAFSLSMDATHLNEQKERLENALEIQDCSLVLDTSKSLLETVFKTILSDRLGNANLSQDMNPLYRNVRDCLQLNDNPDVNDKIKIITNSMVHNISELRNRYGAASHGDDGYYVSPITPTDASFVAGITDVFCSYLYRRHKESSDPNLSARIYYDDYEEFNDWLDGQFSSFSLLSGGEVSYSRLMFEHDLKGYRASLLQYVSTEEDDEELENNV
ncbi:abortive infection family protein [uncultured Kushneria sp.]|uniref:abortive infection family protein n=1 Tax=uncultured Kushneria sp. TaxID=905033 RepID=UPI0026217EC7|nr:abortive infection family protein [uncultured Kushneria sp.]